MNNKFNFSTESPILSKTDTELSVIIYFQEFSFTDTSLGIIICFASCILRPEDTIMIYPHLPYDTGLSWLFVLVTAFWAMKYLFRNTSYLNASWTSAHLS